MNDTPIEGRYYWVQFYYDKSWQLGKCLEGGYFDTAQFYQDWYHPEEAIKWVLIPTPEELLEENEV